MKNLLHYFFALLLFSSCAVGKNYSPAKKYAAEDLKKDYRLFRNILEESHPSLYWYTSKDSMDLFFERGESKLKDSLHEYQFRNILSNVISNIYCGHTVVRPSRAASRYASRARSFSFPLSVKAWDDTVVVTHNMNRNDSTVPRGVILKKIEGRPVNRIIDSLFHHISADGYNTTHKYQTLSNGGAFRNYYGNIFGLRRKMKIDFIDSLGVLRSDSLNVYNPVADTPAVRVKRPKISRRERKEARLNAARNLRFDTTLNAAILEVNTFTKKNRLRGFLRRSFKEIHQKGIQHLVVDMRANGGGSVTLSNLLTKYIADKPFKIADSLYAIKKWSRYSRFQNNYLVNRLFFIFMTRKKSTGNYHFALFENKYFKPKKKNNFDGETYILIGGNTFSAASLFTKALKDQENVLVIGEETGGGAYGNSAWLIPEVTLPKTGVRFRLPLFRLVTDVNEIKGKGVIPEVEVKPTVDAVRKNRDFKMEKTLELIRKRQEDLKL